MVRYACEDNYLSFVGSDPTKCVDELKYFLKYYYNTQYITYKYPVPLIDLVNSVIPNNLIFHGDQCFNPPIVYITWFAIRELLYNNFIAIPTQEDIIISMMIFPCEYALCFDLYKPDWKIRRTINNIIRIAKRLYNKYHSCEYYQIDLKSIPCLISPDIEEYDVYEYANHNIDCHCDLFIKYFIQYLEQHFHKKYEYDYVECYIKEVV